MSSRPFDASAFVDLADDLLAGLSSDPTKTSHSDQAKVRASIGRSYYGAYLFARGKLESVGRLTPTGRPEDHQKVIAALGGVGSRLGGMLDRLRSKRNHADYNLNPRGMTFQSGQHWAGIARQLLHDLANLP